MSRYMSLLAGIAIFLFISDGQAARVSAGDSGELLMALAALQDHLDGKQVLDAAQIDQQKRVIEQNARSLGSDEKTLRAAFDVVSTHDRVHGPLFVAGKTFTRIGELHKMKPPPTDIHWSVFCVMQEIMRNAYNADTVERYTELIDGYKFASCADFPGDVAPPADPKAEYKVNVNASYAPVQGRTGDKWAREATGAYLAPGSIATVTVPDSLVGKGFKIRVGGHSRWQPQTRIVKRLDIMTTTYPIAIQQVRVANPLGGSIYIEVPFGADAGIVEITIQNAVRAPHFSAKRFDRTTNEEWQEVERNQPAPWADFQSDRFMMLVPACWIRKLDDPVALIADWDKAMDICNDLMGLPQVQGREMLYVTVDRQMGYSGAMKPGYPTSNHGYEHRNKCTGLSDNHLIRGPQYAPHWVFHELGHDYRFVKFWGEEETAVNLLFTAVLNKGFDVDIDTAFSRSKDERPFNTIDHAAVAWMTCTTFGKGLPMSTGGAELRRYQSQGFAKYVDIGRLFGWEALERFWSEMNRDHQVPAGELVKRDYDELSLRLSKAAGADLTPLLKFWGIHPESPDALKAAIAEAGLPASAKVYDTLVRYKTLPPADNAAFREFASQWWGKELKDDANQLQSKNEHFEQLTAYNAESAETIRKVVQGILDEYFPAGENEAVSNHTRDLVSCFAERGTRKKEK